MLSALGLIFLMIIVFFIGFYLGAVCLGHATKDKCGQQFYKEWIEKLNNE